MIKAGEMLVSVLSGEPREILADSLEELRGNETPIATKVFLEIAVILGHQEGLIQITKPITLIPLDELKQLLNQFYKAKMAVRM